MFAYNMQNMAKHITWFGTRHSQMQTSIYKTFDKGHLKGRVFKKSRPTQSVHALTTNLKVVGSSSTVDMNVSICIGFPYAPSRWTESTQMNSGMY